MRRVKSSACSARTVRPSATIAPSPIQALRCARRGRTVRTPRRSHGRNAGVTENNTTRQATVDIVTTGFFETLGVQPVHGRDFTMDEERPGTPARSVIVSYKVWERSGLDRDILTQTVRINGQDFAIVGVSPQQLTGTTAILVAEYYMPVGMHDAIASDVDDRRFPIRIAAAAR